MCALNNGLRIAYCDFCKETTTYFGFYLTCLSFRSLLQIESPKILPRSLGGYPLGIANARIVRPTFPSFTEEIRFVKVFL